MLTFLLAIVSAAPTDLPLEEEPVEVSETGAIEFDSRIPAEIRVAGVTLAQLYQPGVLQARVPVGAHEVVVLTNGRARTLKVDVSSTATAVVLVGRNGLTASARLEPLPEEEGMAPVELRVVGREEVIVVVDEERYRLLPGTIQALTLPVGRHAMSVRSASGTVVWARGHLELSRTVPTILQITEGRMPEVSGSGALFVPGS